jgi:ubiquinone/menaquinone biosynthesis C-methylase UbiE
MEERKLKEIEYYDSRVAESKDYQKGDFEGFNPLSLSSFRFLYELLKKNSEGKLVLDYGCGNGIHSAVPARAGAEKVIGIDLSEKSLEAAREKIKKEGLEDKVKFIKMDCEKLDFPDNYFDLILDGGTFSSLDFNKAVLELRRVLKQDGMLIGIETFGHNPLTNLKRKLNKLTGKRTGWAAEHIFREENMRIIRNYFNETQYYYFHLVSWLAIPFLGSGVGNMILAFLELTDRILLGIFPFLKKYSFKVVFVLK